MSWIWALPNQRDPPHAEKGRSRQGAATLSRRVVAALFLAGCFSPDFQSGHLHCSAAGDCPPGLRCLANRCYAEGDGPDLSSMVPLDGSVDAATRDTAVAADLSGDMFGVDATAVGDLSVVPDMTVMADVSVPLDLLLPADLGAPVDMRPVLRPTAFWISSGGGSPVSTTGSHLNISIGGTPVVRISTVGGASASYGPLSTDSIP